MKLHLRELTLETLEKAQRNEINFKLIVKPLWEEQVFVSINTRTRFVA